MVKNRHYNKENFTQSDVIRLDYQPSGAYSLDIKIFSVSSLRKRFGKEQMQLPHQYAFGMLLFVCKGECTQWIDFTPVHCQVGSLLTLSPEQAHRFGDKDDWDGWVMLFQPEFISTPTLTKPQSFNFKVKDLTQEIPEYLLLDEREQNVVRTLFGK